VLICFSPAWWLWRSVHTRSHLELGRKSLQRQWYFVLRRGRVGRCQACEKQNFIHDPIIPNPPCRNAAAGFVFYVIDDGRAPLCAKSLAEVQQRGSYCDFKCTNKSHFYHFSRYCHHRCLGCFGGGFVYSHAFGLDHGRGLPCLGSRLPVQGRIIAFSNLTRRYENMSPGFVFSGGYA
jgi:hypothetical protein